MAKPRVFVTRSIAQEALDMIDKDCELEVWPGELPPSYEVLREKVADVDGLLVLLTDKVDAALIDAAPKLRVISNFAVGYDNIDIASATKHGIVVGHTPGVLKETTADFAFALMMAAARRVVEADSYTRKGFWKTWGPMLLLGQDIHHTTLGIIGLGHIGTEVTKRARGFAMRILYYSRTRRPEEEVRLGVEYIPDLAELLRKADFISIHVPLTPETYHLIGPDELAMMKPTAVLVNTARGPVVDQRALYEALRDKKIFAAGLDVTEVEPIPADDPLLTLDNVIITSHIGSASYATRREMAVMAAEKLLAGLRGELPQDCINPEALGT